jgi:GNAT superfamily N-acetyltransferase
MAESLQLPRLLGGGLILRAVETDADAEKVIAINAAIHGADEASIVRHWLFEGHPTIFRGGWLYIEDPTAGRAVATLCLIPMTWSCAGQLLPVAELGFVGTLPNYRRRGLQRVLSDAFDQLALGRGFVLAAIEGIPGFYGQFGYEYALPLEGGFDLEFEQIPDEPVPAGYTPRPAAPMDILAVQRLYDDSIATLDLSAARDAALWKHQLAVPEGITFYGATTVIERDSRIVGYLRWNANDRSDRLRILELAVGDGPGARERILVALRFARDQARSGCKCGLRLRLPTDHLAVVFARYLGAMDRGHYGWQMKVLDPVGFMQAIGPALEARLAGSLLAGYSGSLVFNLYPSRLTLRFDAGRLVEVSAPTGEVEADAGLTLPGATQLWLGWRGREALEEWYPDFWSRQGARHLLDVLFPRARAYIYQPY